MKVYLITKNQGKIKAAQSVFSASNIEVGNIETEYPEIQADSSLEIAKYTAQAASSDSGLPVIREDHSLFINALGIPGPYTAFIEKKIPPEMLLKLLSLHADRTGYFEIALAYADTKNGINKEYVYKVPVYFKNGEDVKDPRGGWNGIICLEGETRAFTEYPEEERINVWNKNYLQLAHFLSETN